MTTVNHDKGVDTAARAPRWAVIAAHAVPLLVLPSAVWRLHTALFKETPCHDPSDLGRSAYMVFLSVVSLVLAGLTIGLVRRWGETYPRWIPRLGGRTVPAGAVVRAGLVGGVLICCLFAYALLNGIFEWVGPLNELPDGCAPPGLEVGRYYMPMLAWGPLLIAVTLDYRRRHPSP